MPGKSKKTSIPPVVEIISQRNTTFFEQFAANIAAFSKELNRAISTIPVPSTLIPANELRKLIKDEQQQLTEKERKLAAKKNDDSLLPDIIQSHITVTALYLEMGDYKPAYWNANLAFRKSDGLTISQELILFKATSAFQMTLAASKNGNDKCISHGHIANYYYLKYLGNLLANKKDEHFATESKNCFISIIRMTIALGIAHWERLNSKNHKGRILYNLREANFHFSQTLSVCETLKFLHLDDEEKIALPQEIIKLTNTLTTMLNSCLQEFKNTELTYSEKYEYFLYAKNISRLLKKFSFVLKQFKPDEINYSFFEQSEVEIENLWLSFEKHCSKIGEEKSLLVESMHPKERAKKEQSDSIPIIENNTEPTLSVTASAQVSFTNHIEKIEIIDHLVSDKNYQEAFSETQKLYEMVRQNPDELFLSIRLIYKLAEIKMKIAHDNSKIINLEKIFSENSLITTVEQTFICNIFASYHEALITCKEAAEFAEANKQYLEKLRLVGSNLVGKIIDLMEELCELQSNYLLKLFNQCLKEKSEKDIANGYWMSNNLKNSLVVLHNAKQLFGKYQLLDNDHAAKKHYFFDAPPAIDNNNANAPSKTKSSYQQKKKKSYTKSKKPTPESQLVIDDQPLPTLPTEATETYTNCYQNYTPAVFYPVGYFYDPYGNIYFGNYEWYSHSLHLYQTNLYISAFVIPVYYAFYTYESYANYYAAYYTPVPTAYPTSAEVTPDRNIQDSKTEISQPLTSLGADHSTFFKKKNTSTILQRSKSDSELYKSHSITLMDSVKTI